MRNPVLAVILSVAALSVLDLSSPAAAASAFQWCPVGRLGWGETGVPSCGFSSYEQCVAVTGGVCTQNPFYTGPSGRPPGNEVRRGRTER